MTQFWAKLFHLDDLAGTEAREQGKRGTARLSINKRNEAKRKKVTLE